MNYKGKACSPKETIQRIDQICFENNLNISETWHTTKNEYDICSCSVFINDKKNSNTNGKGTDYLYALASGKAELLERLQGYYLVRRQSGFQYFADEKENTLPYLNLYSNEIKYINYDDIFSSTGLASGNTYEEAIVHAICELVERYCYWLFCNNNLKINGIINYNQQKWFNLCSKFNAKIVLFDVSILNIPVVVMLLLREDNIIGMELDCAPTYKIAIERCFTEMFQGHDLSNEDIFPQTLFALRGISMDPQDAYHILVGEHNGYYPKNMLDPFLNYKYDYSLTISEDEEYDNNFFIYSFLKNNNIFGNIYLRDFSFLNFPTVYLKTDFSFERPLYRADFITMGTNMMSCFVIDGNNQVKDNFGRLLNSTQPKFSNPIVDWDLHNKIQKKSIKFKMDMSIFKNLTFKQLEKRYEK